MGRIRTWGVGMRVFGGCSISDFRSSRGGGVRPSGFSIPGYIVTHRLDRVGLGSLWKCHFR